jgi:hypothetical protein
LLNHDFLARNSIVPDDWRVHDVIVSPPFSNILYDNGVQFVVELNKFQVRVNNPDLVDPVQNLPRMVTKYLRVLPHVAYRGVGINFVCIVKDQERDIVRSLLKDGPWLDFNGGVGRAAIEFMYRGGQPRFSVKIEQAPGDDPGQSESSSGIVFSANFHHDFEPDADQARVEYISAIKDCEDRFMDYLKSLPVDCE